MVQSVLDEQKSAPANVLRIIEAVSKHTNTPRKKPKFINFVKNVCGHKTNPKDIDQAWDLISVKLSALSNANNRNQNQKKEALHEFKKNENQNVKEPELEQEDSSQASTEVQDDDEEISQKTDEKKLTKKERKEEKKRRKYESELQSAEAPPPEEAEEEVESKKGKKKKNKSESIDDDDDSPTDGKNGKNKKRKRQDTVNSNCNTQNEPMENDTELVENIAPAKEKIQKKKQRTKTEEAEESLCLHDQNVAKIGELAVSGDKFDWHAVIKSVLEKKGNEVPFKRLQKKVLAEYSEATGYEVDDRIADKFIKKLKSAPNVRVDKNRVLLID